MKDRVISIGEALIDFMPEQTGAGIPDVASFAPAVGGAPANVCGAFTKLGGKSAMITQLGVDGFGDKIVNEFKQHGIGCEYVKRTDKANTSLAFVALKEDGNREFSFYRNPGADMLYDPEDIKEEWFEDVYALHFCSVSLGDFPMKEAHRKAIEYASKHGTIISFDPNLRPALWKDTQSMVDAIKEFLPYADIIKVSDEELEVLTGKTDIYEALGELFYGNTKILIYTEGAAGARAFSRFAASKPVKAIDTTGAGDGFIGSFLYSLYANGMKKEELGQVPGDKLVDCLAFSNAFCGISVQKKGAIVSYPTMEQMKEVLAEEE